MTSRTWVTRWLSREDYLSTSMMLSFLTEKMELVDEGYQQVDEVVANYNMGFITNNERYNQIIDIWTHTNARLTQTLLRQLSSDKQGFNPVYMMLDSGARGSKEQIRQLSGMSGLMAKPQKSGSTGVRDHRKPNPFQLQGRTVGT